MASVILIFLVQCQTGKELCVCDRPVFLLGGHQAKRRHTPRVLLSLLLVLVRCFPAGLGFGSGDRDGSCPVSIQTNVVSMPSLVAVLPCPPWAHSRCEPSPVRSARKVFYFFLAIFVKESTVRINCLVIRCRQFQHRAPTFRGFSIFPSHFFVRCLPKEWRKMWPMANGRTHTHTHAFSSPLRIQLQKLVQEPCAISHRTNTTQQPHGT